MGLPKLKTLSELEEHHNQIAELFDLAEELIGTVDNKSVNPKEQIKLVEPLAAEVAEAADILSEEYITIIEAQDKRRKIGQKRVELAFRKIYSALSDYKNRAKALGKNLRNVAEPIIERITRHAEKLIVTFLDFVDLSLERIMHKNEIEELRQRESKIAVMLHQLGHS